MHSEAVRASRSLPRRVVLRTTLAGAVVAAGGAILAACGAEGTASAPPAAPTTSVAASVAAARSTVVATVGATSVPNAGANAATQPARPAQAPVVEGQIASGVDGVPDAYAKLPPPFRAATTAPGKGGKVRSFMIAFSEPPTARNDNTYWKELEKRFGVQWDAQLAPADSYLEKYSAVTASGDLPELTYLNPAVTGGSVQLQALKQGAFTDLTPFLSGDGLKEFPNLAQYPAFIWKNVAFQGKIYGVPKPILGRTACPSTGATGRRSSASRPREPPKMSTRC